MEPLDDAVRLRPLHARGAMDDVFELQEEFVRMAVFAAAEFSAVVGKNGLDFRAMRLEVGKHVAVHEVHVGDGQLRGVQPCPTVVRVTVDRRLQIDFVDAIQCAH